MNNPKAQPSGGPNSIYSKKLPWQHAQQQEKPVPTANYTLPGVINYLSSEFTNLERFKIMTSLEISEMKHRIMQLHGELNSARYLNENQKLRIEELEKENRRLQKIIGSPDESVKELSSNDDSKISNTEIPEVHLLAITRSRDQLTSSMKEIMTLLKVPSKACSNFNIEGLNSSNHFQDLVENDDNGFPFILKNDEQKIPKSLNKEINFSQYLKENTSKSEEEENNRADEAINDIFENKPVNVDELENQKINSEYESDAETVLFDYDDNPNTLNPQATIEFKDKNFQASKIDSNNEFITYLNFDENSEVPISEINIWAVNLNNIALSVTGIIPFSDNPSNIIRIYTLSCTKTIANIILIYNSGIIEHLSVDNGKFTSKARNVHIMPNFSVHSADLDEVTKSPGEPTRSFGLIICTGRDKITHLKITHLIVGNDVNETELIEIGDYDQQFFNASDQSEFYDVTWYRNSMLPSTPTTEKEEGLINKYSLYAQHKIMFELNSQLILLNIKLNEYETLYKYDSGKTHYKCPILSNYTLLCETESQSDYYRANILDITSKEVVSSIDVSSPNLTLIEYDGKILVIELSDEKLLVYDTKSQKKRELPVNSAYKIDSLSNKLLLYSNLHTLRVYDINDSFKVQ